MSKGITAEYTEESTAEEMDGCVSGFVEETGIGEEREEGEVAGGYAAYTGVGGDIGIGYIPWVWV